MGTQKEDSKYPVWREDHESRESSCTLGSNMEKNDRRRPWPVMAKADSFKQLYVITFFPSNFLPSTPGLGLIKREFKTCRT